MDGSKLTGAKATFAADGCGGFALFAASARPGDPARWRGTRVRLQVSWEILLLHSAFSCFAGGHQIDRKVAVLHSRRA